MLVAVLVMCVFLTISDIGQRAKEEIAELEGENDTEGSGKQKHNSHKK